MATLSPVRTRRPSDDACDLSQRAIAIWPHLDPRGLADCGCDAALIAAYVARRTDLSTQTVTQMLEVEGRTEREMSFYFG